MAINSALAAGMLLWSLISGPTPSDTRTRQIVPASIKVAASVDSFAPPPRAKKRRPSTPRAPQTGTPSKSPDDETDEGQASSATRRSPSVPASRRRPAASEDEGQDETAAEEDDEDEKPKGRKKAHKRDEDEEEEDGEDDAPMASLPVIIPRLFSVEAGGAATGRSFQYNTALQKEGTFPRLGLILAVEAYPLIRMAHGWAKKIGIGINLNMEFGSAALMQSTGASVSFPVAQRRLGFDVRYAIPAGEHVLIVPAVGYASNTFDLKTKAPVDPSGCSNMSPMPCIADIQATYLEPALYVRIAATPEFSVSLSGGYFLGLGVAKGVGQIANERTAKTSGFQAELGANMMLMDWLAARASVPFVSYQYAFSGGSVAAATYTSAAETYYGANVGLVIFTR